MNKLFAYPGGKSPIRHIVVNHFAPHVTYVDVFGGSAAILLAKKPSKGEAFNDKNELIVNFFRVVKHRPAELAEKARLWIHSRKFFAEIRDGGIPSDELEKAFYMWVLLADSFGARCLNFGTAKHGIHSVTHAREYLSLVAERLADVHIECLDFAKCIDVYDSPETLFYCDPPYRNTKGGNSNYNLLSDEEWQLLFKKLSNIEGKFLLSSNADEYVVDLFKKFNIKEIDVRVSLPRIKSNQVRKEVLIANYPFPIQDVKKTDSRKSVRASKVDKPAMHSNLKRSKLTHKEVAHAENT